MVPWFLGGSCGSWPQFYGLTVFRAPPDALPAAGHPVLQVAERDQLGDHVAHLLVVALDLVPQRPLGIPLLDLLKLSKDPLGEHQGLLLGSQLGLGLGCRLTR